MKFRAVLFDFDGTLADSFAAITASVNAVRSGVGLPRMSEPEVRRHVGYGLPQLLQTVVPTLPVNDAMMRYREHHAGTMLANTTLFPNVLSTVQQLHAAGVKLGICSNKAVAFTKELVKGLALGPYFGAICGPEDAAGVPKPAPEMLYVACKTLDVLPGETLFIGDMAVDVEAGQNAGMPVWLVHVGIAGTQAAADFVGVRILNEFRDVLEVLNPG